MRSRLSHIIGFDDFAFPADHRGAVPIVGAIYAHTRLDGVLCGAVLRDGDDATAEIGRLVADSRFAEHLQLIMLQGIALAGFNVVDIHQLHAMTTKPVLVVCRRKPQLDKIAAALRDHVPGGAAKWALIQQAGEMETLSGVFVQRAGLALDEAADVLARFCDDSAIPTPLRTAHLIASGVSTGESRGRV